MLFVTEVLCHGQTGKGNTHTDARGFVHLSEYQCGLVRYTAFPHLLPEIIALTASLTDTGEDGIAAVLHGNVVNELLNQNGFANAGTAEQADLTALGIGLQQVNDLDAGLQYFNGGTLLGKGRGIPVNALVLGICGDGVTAVNGLAQYVKHTAKGLLPYGDLNGLAGGKYLHAPIQPLTAGEHDATNCIVAHMLGNLHNMLLALQLNAQRFADPGQMTRGKLYVYHRAGDLYNGTCFHSVSHFLSVLGTLGALRLGAR